MNEIKALRKDINEIKKSMATKDDLKKYATKEDLKGQIEGLKKVMATKDDLKDQTGTIIDHMDSFFVRDSRAHGMELMLKDHEERLLAVEHK